jgi:hypothetical protein
MSEYGLMSGTQVCLACSRPIEGKYYSYDGAGPYCRECTHSRSPCDVCAAPLTQEYWQLSDGRLVCSNCHATAIYDPAAATALYQELKDRIGRLLGLKLNIPTGLALVDRNQLQTVLVKQAQGASPPASAQEVAKTLGLYARRGLRRGIYIQTGLPRLLFLQIAAHEFAHAWQGENCPLLRNEHIHEGFAEWVSYHVLGSYGYGRGQERMLARQDIYGDGLRWALDVQQRQGMAAVMAICRMDQGGG